MGRKYGFSFSWKRALGISSAKARISRKTGIPMTRSGMERKIGRTLMKGGGCCIPFVLMVTGILALLVVVIVL